VLLTLPFAIIPAQKNNVEFLGVRGKHGKMSKLYRMIMITGVLEVLSSSSTATLAYTTLFFTNSDSMNRDISLVMLQGVKCFIAPILHTIMTRTFTTFIRKSSVKP